MTLISERPPVLEAEPVSSGTELRLRQLSLQQQIIQRGDRQLPEEPNRGFVIERLEGNGENQPVPLAEAISAINPENFAQGVLDGSTPLKIAEHYSESSTGFMVYFRVPGSKYREAVAAGKVEDGLFGTEGKVSRMKPGAEALDTLVDDEHRQTMLEKYFEQQAHTVKQNFVNDLEAVGAEALSQVEGLSEAFEFSDGDRSMRLLNLSRTKLSDEQLRQAASVIRSFSDKSGGELFDRLRTILILPEGSPRMSVTARDEGGEFALTTSGEATGTSLLISENSIKKPEDRTPRTERVQRYWDKAYNKHLQPGEPTEGPGKPYHNASRSDWEILLAHELEHIALPANDVPLPGPGPTLYSRFNKREQEAELGALDYKGGEEALAVPEDQRQAKQEMWYRRRGSDDGGQTYKQPLGPRFVTCRELETHQGPLPPRLKYPGRPIITEINYRLAPEV